ncbi:MAG TPA: threonine/serine exporter [Desulfitobacterium dehalogenans]|uniref:Threonine/serine exporter n=1 Tax=Desulfitobacterium dehalogenans TaxID=36854 RepID=A0A7C7D8C4_9FIRM|nr:threonine/serine exporter [Desulfitobacterium dehalogenans]
MNWTALYASFFATMAFGVLFNVPRKSLLTGGLVGMLGWAIFVTLTVNMKINIITATLFAAFCVATVSQILARRYKMPVTVFSISGIIPLVPGGMAYDTIRQFIENNYTEGVRLGTITLLIAGSIAFGLIFSGVITETFSRKRGYPKPNLPGR